jgi:hypothetical protein
LVRRVKARRRQSGAPPDQTDCNAKNARAERRLLRI